MAYTLLLDRARSRDDQMRTWLLSAERDEEHPLQADLDALEQDGAEATLRLRFDWLPDIPDALPEEDAEAAMAWAMAWSAQVMPPHVEGGDMDG